MNPRIKALEDRRDAAIAAMEAADTLVIERGDARSEEEQAAYDAHQAEFDAVEAELPKLIEREQQIARSRELSRSLGDAVRRDQGDPDKAGDPAGGGGEPIYRAEEMGGKFGFIADLHAAKGGMRAAQERLEIHRAASASSDLPGLVVPTYLIEKYQELAVQRGRPFLNALVGTLSYRSTVEEMSVVIPRETQAPTVDAQATQNTAFSSTAWTTEEFTVSTVTVGGYLDLSVQAVALGRGVGQDRLFGEMLMRYYNRQDYLALHGSGAAGEPEGLFNADGTQVVDADTVSGFAEHIAVIQEAASKIEINDFREAMFVLMSPGRWRALMSATESTGRPLAGFNGSFPQNVGAYMDGQGQKWLGGLRVITDQNVVKAGEDDTFMAVFNTDAFYFAETDPKRITADQVIAHTGGVRFVTYGFMQFTPEVRVNSLCIIQDLTTPEFPTLAVS